MPLTNVRQARVFLSLSKSPGHGIKGPDAQMGLDTRKPDFGACEQQRRRTKLVSINSLYEETGWETLETRQKNHEIFDV